MNPQHDHAYKLLFSHAEMVRDLLTGFVHEAWVERVDFSTLERVSGTYVGDDLREREDDVIWRVRLVDTWLYVHILLEFQATVDDFMPLRMVDYVASLYQDLRKSGRLTNRKPPPVLPVVLYNGEPRWNAPREVESLITPVPGLEPYRLRMHYLLLDEGALAESGIDSLRNLAAALFRLEKSRSPEQIREVVRLLGEWLQAPPQASLRRAFTVWLGRVLLPRRAPGTPIPEMTDLHEVNHMLAHRVEEWTRQWREEGLEQGRLEGLSQGRMEGRVEEAAALIDRLLHKRFGPLPPWARERVAGASLPQLEKWTERLLEVGTLEELFSDPDQPASPDSLPEE